MQWIAENWMLLLLVGGMVAMHLFGHGHGHGKQKSKQISKDDDVAESSSNDER